MTYEIINSGSDGNCIIVEKFFMLDCGVSYKKIKPYLDKVRIIFISHSHSDHYNKNTLKQIHFNYPNIKFVVGSKDLVKKLNIESEIRPSSIFILPCSKWYNLGALKVKLEGLTHDVPNHLCKFEIRNKKGIYIVDTGNVYNIIAKNYDLYLIESNYMDNILEKNRQYINENELYNHLYRVEEVHLSYKQSMDFLIDNMGENSRYELIHKSKINFNESEMD